VVLFLNLLVATTKTAAGLLTGALALVADGVHSFLDASSNVVGLIGMAVASRPPDAGHPYGHRRFETLAALVIGLLIAGGFVEVLRTVGEGLLYGRDAPQVSVWLAAFVAATVVINLFISRYEHRRGQQLRSALLTADSGHTFSDALAALVVLVSLGATALGWAWADMAAALIVCVFIGRTAWHILAENLGALSDQAQVNPDSVRDVALSIPGVRGAHMVRSRGSSDWVLVDLHIQLDPTLSLADAHEKSHEVTTALTNRFPEIKDVVIHTEPADGHQHNAPVAPGRTS
jgi:cation diffusion facilitator family transporter